MNISKPMRLTAAAAVLLIAAGASAVPTREVEEALRLADPVAVEALLARPTAPTSAERLLLEAARNAYRLRDAAALEKLRRFLASPSRAPEQRRSALMMLGAIEMRHGRYASAADAFGAALPLAESGTALSPGDRQGLRQSVDVAAALHHEPAPRRGPLRRSKVALSRDAAGLARADVLINGKIQGAILDTGANLSVIARSAADAFGLRLVGPEISVASPTSAATPARLAVARSVTIGSTEFTNVVFLVFPDADLSFANGAYRIEAILGFPLLSQLERLTFARDGNGETLSFEASNGRPDATSDLFVDGLTPKLLLGTPGADRRLVFALDSGADKTTLRPRFAAELPERMKSANAARLSLGGAGATVGRDALVLKDLSLTVDGRPHPVGSVSLYREELSDAGSHGRVGQDLLRAGSGYVLDFRRMDFRLLPAAR